MVVGAEAGGDESWLGTFGEAWVETLCAVAGCPAGRLRPDVVGTDLVVHDASHEMIRFQVKATEHPDRSGHEFRYSLAVGTYDRLRQGPTPGYLALVVVHRPRPRWTGHYGTGSVVRATAYWSRLAGLPSTPNTSTVTVTVPVQNLLTPSSLLELFTMEGDEDGQPA